MKETILNKAMQAKDASRFIARASTDKKNKIILRMADYIKKKKDELIKANDVDVKNAEKKGLQRLLLIGLPSMKKEFMR
ncbi:hypothetical protein THER_1468 [Thermodesulfovibrio sp. N1]|uniref:hypothetical protein n=1 Tax=Thermodesulfovibrio sp. N1 TaxID=1871110 RepID=UPI00085659AA|nr:hypothetical protein [Thermodesulfovibrio sp. N1]ODA43792.1 hypothetical protein THER_1468 [Thermodesulfovibrio sp. N1]